MPGVTGESMQTAKHPIRRVERNRTEGLRRLPLASLRVFVAAGERLSFCHAAETLGVSTAAVSMQIRALEEYLRVPLFTRNSRSIQLTGEGGRLLSRVRDALNELERAMDEARTERHSGALTVSMPASFLQQWLLPLLPDFERRHPEIDLRIHTSAALVDFLHSDVQAAVRFGTGNWHQVHAEKLFHDWLVPVCTKAILETHGVVETRDDLKRHHLLHARTEAWRDWPNNPTIDEWAPHGATLDDSVSVVRAAESGQGLALARWSLVANEIHSGRLVIASRKLVRMDRAYFFVCPVTYLALGKITAFREWLLQQCRSRLRNVSETAAD